MEMIPYGKHHVEETDIEAVAQVLRSNFLTQGPVVERFEAQFKQRIGAARAIACNSGTAALHLSVLALDLQPGQTVITTPLTFAASANCARYVGADVAFADIDLETGLLDPESVRELIEAIGAHNVAGIIPVDYAGLAVPLTPFRKLADEYGCWILEDACHAPGANWLDSDGELVPSGGSELADAAIFSFHPVKHVAGGEGGMVTTSRPEIEHKIRRLRTHGITKDPAELQYPEGGWYYEMQDLGFNYRMSDIHAALAISQLDRLSENLNERNRIADEYCTRLAGYPIEPVARAQISGRHAYHLFVVKIAERHRFYDYLHTHGILAQVHYIPVHRHPFYRNQVNPIALTNAEQFYDSCISLPLYPSLSAEQVDHVVAVCKGFFDGNE